MIDDTGPLEPGTLVPVTIRHAGSGTEERRELVVHFDMLPADARGAHRRLVVRVTDPGDLLFLYTLVLPEQDFLVLKRAQKLSVDFGGFPEELQELLNKSLDSGSAPE